jgi:hypothetical protein
MTGENDSERLRDVIESDQAVVPDAKVAEELRMLTENEEGSEKEQILTACAVAKIPLQGHIVSKKLQGRHKENTALINMSQQLDRQTTRIERMSSVRLSIQVHIKSLVRQQLELIKQLQSQKKIIQNHTSQVKKYVTKKKKKNITWTRLTRAWRDWRRY